MSNTKQQNQLTKLEIKLENGWHPVNLLKATLKDTPRWQLLKRNKLKRHIKYWESRL